MSSTTGPQRDRIVSILDQTLHTEFSHELMMVQIERHLKQANPDLEFDEPFEISNAVVQLQQAERSCHLLKDNLLSLVCTQIQEQIAPTIDIDVEQLKNILIEQNIGLQVIALDAKPKYSYYSGYYDGYLKDIHNNVEKLNNKRPQIEVAILNSQIEQIKRNFPVPPDLNKLLGRLETLSIKKQKTLKLEFINLIKALNAMAQQSHSQETLTHFYKSVFMWKQKARNAYIKRIYKHEDVLISELCKEMSETIEQLRLFDLEMPVDMEQMTLRNFNTFLNNPVKLNTETINLLDRIDIPEDHKPSQHTKLFSIIRALEYVKSRIEEINEMEVLDGSDINKTQERKSLQQLYQVYHNIIREHSKELPLFLDANAPAAMQFVEETAAAKSANTLQTILGWMSWINQKLGSPEMDIAKTSVMAGPVSAGAMQLIQKAITGTVKDKIESAVAGRFEGKFTQLYEKGDFEITTPMLNKLGGAKAGYVTAFYLTNLRKLDIKISYLEQIGETQGATYTQLKNVFVILKQHFDEIKEGTNINHFDHDLDLVEGMLKANKENLYIRAIESTQLIQRYLSDELQISREATTDPVFMAVQNDSLRLTLQQRAEPSSEMVASRQSKSGSLESHNHKLTVHNNDKKLLAHLHFMNNLRDDVEAIDEELGMVALYKENKDNADFTEKHINETHEKLTKVHDVLNLTAAIDRLIKDDPSVLIAWWEDNILKKYIFMPQEQRRDVALLKKQNDNIQAAKKLTLKMHEGKSLWHILVDLPEGQGELVFDLLMKKLDAAPAGATQPWELGDVFDPNVKYHGMNPMEYAKINGKQRMYQAFLKRIATCKRSMSEDEVSHALGSLLQSDRNAKIVLDYMDKWIKQTYPKRMLDFLSRLREIPKDLVTKGFSGTLMELKYLSSPDVIKRQVSCSLLLWADKHGHMPRSQNDLKDFIRNLHLAGQQCTTVPVDMLLEKTYAPETMQDTQIERGAHEMTQLLNMENALLDFIETQPHDAHLQSFFEVFTSHILQSEHSDRTNAMQQLLIALVKGEYEAFESFYKNEFKNELLGDRNLFYLACELDQAEIAKFLHFTKGVAGDGGPKIEDTTTNHPLQTFYENKRRIITETALTCAARRSPNTFLVLCNAVEKKNRATPSGLYRFCMDSHGKAPIHYAFEKMPFTHIKAYLDLEHLRWDKWSEGRVKRLWNMPDKDGNHPLHLLAGRDDAAEIVKSLIKYTETTYKPGYLGSNLFKYCINIDCLAGVNKFGETILGLLRQNGNYRALALIFDQAIKQGIGVNAEAIFNDPMLNPNTMDSESLAFFNFELMRMFDKNKSNSSYVSWFTAFAKITQNNDLVAQIESGQRPNPPRKSKALILRQPQAEGSAMLAAPDEVLEPSSEESLDPADERGWVLVEDNKDKGKQEEDKPGSRKKRN